MAISKRSTSAAIRSRLPHPVIDSDAHTVEFLPAFLEYLDGIGGADLVERMSTAMRNVFLGGWYDQSPEQRRDHRTMRPPWWALPASNTLDRATAMFPRLLSERLDDMGLDFTVVYPTLGMIPAHLEDEELRRIGCRAFNAFHADLFREFADRMTPVAVIPMHTPQEAIDELEHAVGNLGMKAIVLASYVRRPIPAIARTAPATARAAMWLDTFALDSEHDYDPVWAKCVELKVAPTFHSIGMGWDSRRSISNYMHNHMGHFAAACEAICKSLFLGGVTRRFPGLRFAFMEGGVTWAARLYTDLIGHWEKRNPAALQNYNPASVDRGLLLDLVRRYCKWDGTHLAVGAWGAPPGSNEDGVDDWAPCRIERAEDIRDLFVPNFYFGCEGDDPTTAWAFDSRVNPFGAQLKAIFGSDIGHWDVPDMIGILAEAHEPVDKGLLSDETFRDLVFANPVKLWTEMNADFFKGTRVDTAVNDYLGQRQPHASIGNDSGSSLHLDALSTT